MKDLKLSEHIFLYMLKVSIESRKHYRQPCMHIGDGWNRTQRPNEKEYILLFVLWELLFLNSEWVTKSGCGRDFPRFTLQQNKIYMELLFENWKKIYIWIPIWNCRKNVTNHMDKWQKYIVNSLLESLCWLFSIYHFTNIIIGYLEISYC